MLAFQITPLAVADLWLERLAANGISELRTSDPSNTPSYWKQAVDAAKRAGLKTILNVIYSISPKHTDDALTEATSKSAAPRMATVTDPRRFRFTTFAASPGSMSIGTDLKMLIDDAKTWLRTALLRLVRRETPTDT